jgi:hypothetical protein
LKIAGTTKQLFRLEVVRSDEGVSCDQLLDALYEYVEYAWAYWRNYSDILRRRVEELEEFTDTFWVVSGRPKLFLKLGSTNHSLLDIRKLDLGDSWSRPNGTPIERQLEWLPKELVRVEDYVEVRAGKVYGIATPPTRRVDVIYRRSYTLPHQCPEFAG